jgi:heat shock protein HtpX
MKRILLFVVTNLAVVIVLSVVASVLGLDRFLVGSGIDVGMLLIFAAVIGFGGAIISLLISKPIAKWSTGARVIETPRTESEAWLVSTVKKLADRADIGMPEVAIYDGEPNAFATGAFRNSALVAVSTGLLTSMPREEVEAVLGHEVAHISNGDMVTLTLIQGVVNTFVVFLSRVIGNLVDRLVFRTERGVGYYVTVFIGQVVFGVLAAIIVAWFSRRREFRADAGSARYLGSAQPMMNALSRLGGLAPGELPKTLAGFGITDKPGLAALFATHPPIEARIRALENRHEHAPSLNRSEMQNRGRR